MEMMEVLHCLMVFYLYQVKRNRYAHFLNCTGVALHDSHFKVILNHFILGPNAALQSPLTLSLLSLQAGFLPIGCPS